MRLRDVMSERVKTVPAAATADEAWALMRSPIVTNTRWPLRHRVPHRKQALAAGVW